MPTRRESTRLFLHAQKTRHNAPDLLERCLSHPGLEFQVNVAQGVGQPLDGLQAFTDGIDSWTALRVSEEKADWPQKWPLDLHTDAIGTTGWDWEQKVSRLCVYDFDSITGHAEGVGISDDELERVKQAACALDWVEVRRSTGGNGLHLYVLCDEGVPAASRDEHTANARAVLRMMSEAIGFDFSAKVDAVGGNAWIWSRRATSANQGFALIKAAERCVRPDEIPSEYREAMKRSAKAFSDLSTAHRAALDDGHKRIIESLRKGRGSVAWVDGKNCLQSHTNALQVLRESDPTIAGNFRTSSQGKDLGQPNCFLFPIEGSGWAVYRFSEGVAEHESWTQDGSGWTRTTFNVPCTLAEAAEAVGAAETKRGVIVELDRAAEVARMIGMPAEFPDVESRDVTLATGKDGRLSARMPALGTDPLKLSGWARDGKFWERIFGKKASTPTPKATAPEGVRYLIGEQAQNLGFCSLIRGVWIDDAQSSAALTLHAQGLTDKGSQNDALAAAKQNAYTLVTRPFEPEHPAPGLWNRFAPQFAIPPADRDGEYPHYRMVLDHVGRHLTPAVESDPWCAERGIETGADYLMHWLASLVQRPFQLLPMLYFFGPQNSGKSSFANMLLPLFTRGVGKVDKVFTRGNTFDGELAGIVLGIVEEANLTGRHAQSAYSKLKDLTTAKNLSIERKGWDAFEQRNCLHLIQFANEAAHCPILERDDSRIVVSKVEPIAAPVADAVMQAGWTAEAPFFVRALRNLALSHPSPEDSRLWLPTLATPAKAEVIEAVARITGAPENEQSAAVIIQRFEPMIRLLADAGWFFKVTVADILGALAFLGERDLPTANEFGTALAHLDRDGLYIERGRTKKHRWLTIATRRQLWLEDHVEPGATPEELHADETRVGNLL